MTITIFILIFTSALAAFTSATASWGRCEEVTLQKNFKLESHTGLWYEQLRDKHFWQEQRNCGESFYSQEATNDSVYIRFSDNRTHQWEQFTGAGNCWGAHCTIQYNFFLPELDYRILDTDYDTYSIIYSCRSILGVAKKEYIWVLTREKVVG